MGKTVAVWSSVKKTGKTVLLYMLANRLSTVLNKNVKMLLFCANLSYGNLLDLFKVSGDMLNIEDLVNYGLHYSVRAIDISALLPRKENVYFLGSAKAGSTYIGKNISGYEDLLNVIRETFDICFIDTLSTSDNALTNMLLKKCDYVINVINQDKELLDRFSFVTGKDVIYVVNKYRNIFPGKKDLISSYGLKNLFALPHCDILMDMKNRGKLEFYSQLDTEYNKSMGEICSFIAKKLGLEASGEVVSQPRKRVALKSILGGFIDNGSY